MVNSVKKMVQLVLEPKEFLSRGAATGGSTLVVCASIIVQLGLVFVPSVALNLRLSSGLIVSVALVAAVISFAEYLVSTAVIYLGIILAEVQSNHPSFRVCFSLSAYTHIIPLLGKAAAVTIGMAVSNLEGTTFAIPTFINVRVILASLQIHVSPVFERFDIFAVWYVGVCSIGIASISSLTKLKPTAVASAEWLCVAFFNNECLRLLRSISVSVLH